MREKELKELIDSLTNVGYELLEVEVIPLILRNELPTGACRINIAPIEECEKRRVAQKRDEERVST